MNLKSIAFTAMLLTGCVTQAQQAQLTLTTTARALVAVDDALAPRYEAAAVAARESSSSWTEYDTAMVEWNHAEDATRFTHHSLLAAQSGLTAWEQGSKQEWLRAAPCLVRAADQLLLALGSLNISIEILREAITMLGQYVGTCEAAHE